MSETPEYVTRFYVDNNGKQYLADVARDSQNPRFSYSIKVLDNDLFESGNFVSTVDLNPYFNEETSEWEETGEEFIRFGKDYVQIFTNSMLGSRSFGSIDSHGNFVSSQDTEKGGEYWRASLTAYDTNNDGVFGGEGDVEIFRSTSPIITAAQETRIRLNGASGLEEQVIHAIDNALILSDENGKAILSDSGFSQFYTDGIFDTVYVNNRSYEGDEYDFVYNLDNQDNLEFTIIEKESGDIVFSIDSWFPGS
jgi:hypothetical protein